MSIKEIRSTLRPDVLCHLVYRPESHVDGRVNVAPAEEFLQLAYIRECAGRMFSAHRHKRTNVGGFGPTCEAWIILSGSVGIRYFDTNNMQIGHEVLTAGMVSMTFVGGHEYDIMEDAVIVECKTGPYRSRDEDKELM